MNWGMYGILIIFGVFIILLIINPRLSCFGKALRSPLYPVFRKRKSRQIKTEDYGFKLADNKEKQKSEETKQDSKEEEELGSD